MSEITRRTFLGLSAVAIASAVAGACARQEAPTPTPERATPTRTATRAPTHTPRPTATPKPTETPRPAPPRATSTAPPPTPEPPKPWPRGDVPRERTLIYAVPGNEIGGIGIAGPYAQSFNHQLGHAAELEPLYYYSAFADKTYPWLAESHAYNADGTELTFTLRPEAAWSDGTPFTAADVAFTVQMLLRYAPLLRNSAEIKRWVQRVEAVDDITVHLVLTKPNWRLHFDLFTFWFDRGVYLVPKHIYEDVEDPEAFEFYDPGKGWPVVTGAYQTTAFEVTHKYLDLRYEWWAAKAGLVEMPRVERLALAPIAERTGMVQSIVRGEVDVTWDLHPSAVRSALDQAPQLTTFSGRELPYGYIDWWPASLMFHLEKKPYDDPRVRWAVAYAIDQQQVVDTGWKGAGQPTNVPYPYYPALMPYIDSIEDLLAEYDVLERDLGKVEALMAEAGFARDGEGFWVDGEGARPEADIVAPADIYGDIAPLVAEQLRAAGFDARHLWPPGGWGIVMSGEAALWIFGHAGSIVDPHATLDLYHSRQPYNRWKNPAFDAVVDEMASTPMGDPRTLDQFRRAFEIWFRELPEVPLVQ
jgi:peptide/nickel transport system substrate-binding protein